MKFRRLLARACFLCIFALWRSGFFCVVEICFVVLLCLFDVFYVCFVCCSVAFCAVRVLLFVLCAFCLWPYHSVLLFVLVVCKICVFLFVWFLFIVRKAAANSFQMLLFPYLRLAFKRLPWMFLEIPCDCDIGTALGTSLSVCMDQCLESLRFLSLFFILDNIFSTCFKHFFDCFEFQFLNDLSRSLLHLTLNFGRQVKF